METLVDIYGIIASLLVFISFLPKDIKIIRWLNLIGSIFFIIYAININATWTAVTNIGLFFVQTYHLTKIFREERKKDELNP